MSRWLDNRGVHLLLWMHRRGWWVAWRISVWGRRLSVLLLPILRAVRAALLPILRVAVLRLTVLRVRRTAADRIEGDKEQDTDLAKQGRTADASSLAVQELTG